jgi:hypothetical protein
MADKHRLELLESALGELRKTKEGFVSAGETGGHWQLAVEGLEALQEDLKDTTDKQPLELLESALGELRKTKGGFVSAGQTGGHWQLAMQRLDALEEDLKAMPEPGELAGVPKLGPIWNGGTSLLQHNCTHQTDGLPLFPGMDDGWHAGREIIAPEDLEITRHSSAVRRDGTPNGKAVHAKGKSGIRYWFGHIENIPPEGAKLSKGERIGVISANHEVPHVHLGINIENLVGAGRELKFGPLIGKQLEALLK